MNTHATPPIASATRTNSARLSMDRSLASGLCLLGCRLGGVERGRQPLLLAVVARPLPEPRPADAGRTMPADDVAVRVLSHQIVNEDVLRDDHVAFHADHL